MLDKSELVAVFQSAFLPLECVAELQNYDHALGFRVYLPSGQYITHKEPDVSVLLHHSQLTAIVERFRAQIASSGVALLPWEPSTNVNP